MFPEEADGTFVAAAMALEPASPVVFVMLPEEELHSAWCHLPSAWCWVLLMMTKVVLVEMQTYHLSAVLHPMQLLRLHQRKKHVTRMPTLSLKLLDRMLTACASSAICQGKSNAYAHPIDGAKTEVGHSES